jgi:hypothetical protein
MRQGLFYKSCAYDFPVSPKRHHVFLTTYINQEAKMCLLLSNTGYHVAHAIRVQLRKQGIVHCWSTIRKGLSSHIRITTTMKREDGKVIHIRKSSRPEPFHRQIYDALHLSYRPGRTIKTII